MINLTFGFCMVCLTTVCVGHLSGLSYYCWCWTFFWFVLLLFLLDICLVILTTVCVGQMSGFVLLLFVLDICLVCLTTVCVRHLCGLSYYCLCWTFVCLLRKRCFVSYTRYLNRNNLDSVVGLRCGQI